MITNNIQIKMKGMIFCIEAIVSAFSLAWPSTPTFTEGYLESTFGINKLWMSALISDVEALSSFTSALILISR